MFVIDSKNAARYLHQRGLLDVGESVTVRELTGGVSNLVLLVESPDRQSFVIKQALPKLRVQHDWHCSVERIWREVDVLQVCDRVLRSFGDETKSENQTHFQGTVPTVLFCDRENYLYGMTAVPDHETWKSSLLSGVVKREVAIACGILLGKIHRATWAADSVQHQLGDQKFFYELRVAPYYEQIAAVHPELVEVITKLIRSIYSSRYCLVHGDFSPKNLLVDTFNVTLIDFEVGHYGDPAFDLGFFLSHLVLKGFRRPQDWIALQEAASAFLDSYGSCLTALIDEATMKDMMRRAIENMLACMLARIDGKSPVEYLTPVQRSTVRRVAKELLPQGLNDFDSTWRKLGDVISR